MKKFIAMAAIAVVMVACNNSGDSDKTDNDTIKPDDTTTVVTPTDTVTVNVADTTNRDTTNNR